KANVSFISLIEKDSPAAFGRLLRGDIVHVVNGRPTGKFWRERMPVNTTLPAVLKNHTYNELVAWIDADKEKVELLPKYWNHPKVKDTELDMIRADMATVSYLSSKYCHGMQDRRHAVKKL
ncbi:unnamed protein product, partial [Schistocephalus solidus]|uniref:PDZ_6 domain-containing protein n=1 Tax=Schistocephalus solidus TaxID=70667 RepID=A0A183TDZ0_SCHSO